VLEVPVPPWVVWQWHGVIALLLLVPSWLLYFWLFGWRSGFRLAVAGWGPWWSVL